MQVSDTGPIPDLIQWDKRIPGLFGWCKRPHMQFNLPLVWECSEHMRLCIFRIPLSLFLRGNKWCYNTRLWCHLSRPLVKAVLKVLVALALDGHTLYWIHNPIDFWRPEYMSHHVHPHGEVGSIELIFSTKHPKQVIACHSGYRQTPFPTYCVSYAKPLIAIC